MSRIPEAVPSLNQFEPFQLHPIGANLGKDRIVPAAQQLSALPPKTFDSLTAISGDMPRCPFTSSERVLRVTPRAAAASVIVRPRGAIHSSNTTMPG